MRKLFILITFLVLAIGNANATKVIRILAIGNSFSEDAVEQYLYDLGKDAGYELIIGNAYRGGQGLESHWKEAMSDGNSFEYRKIIQGKKYNRHHQTLKSIITDESWDYITLQQVSQDSGNPDTYEPFLTNLIAYVKSLATNDRMKLGFHMTWAYSGDSTHSGFVYYGRNQKTMYDSIIEASKAALANHPDIRFIVPSGTAIQNMRATPLGDTMNRDGYHLDYNIGRYTAACTWFEVILKKKATRLTYHPDTIDDATADMAQQAAHNARRNPFNVTEP